MNYKQINKPIRQWWHFTVTLLSARNSNIVIGYVPLRENARVFPLLKRKVAERPGESGCLALWRWLTRQFPPSSNFTGEPRSEESHLFGRPCGSAPRNVLVASQIKIQLRNSQSCTTTLNGKSIWLKKCNKSCYNQPITLIRRLDASLPSKNQHCFVPLPWQQTKKKPIRT